jgi:hypothetical protein
MTNKWKGHEKGLFMGIYVWMWTLKCMFPIIPVEECDRSTSINIDRKFCRKVYWQLAYRCYSWPVMTSRVDFKSIVSSMLANDETSGYLQPQKLSLFQLSCLLVHCHWISIHCCPLVVLIIYFFKKKNPCLKFNSFHISQKTSKTKGG